jgi:hypothetical protein
VILLMAVFWVAPYDTGARARGEAVSDAHELLPTRGRTPSGPIPRRWIAAWRSSPEGKLDRHLVVCGHARHDDPARIGEGEVGPGGWVGRDGERGLPGMCACLSAAVLVGLGANAIAGWWWADPFAALFVMVVAVRERREARRGDSCDGGAQSSDRLVRTVRPMHISLRHVA